ncbi:MAG: T9SS type A sorting domain-containing protein [Ignavibacteria bacterium]
MKNLYYFSFFFFSFSLFSIRSQAQWVQSNGPYGSYTGAITSIVVIGNDLFAGTNIIGEFLSTNNYYYTQKAALELTVSLNMPVKFSLGQNYPNPFNSVTTISFSIPSKSYVMLKIFDVLGKEISILISKEMNPGVYTQQWDAAGFPSGVYFYSLEAGSFSETKKLILLR